MLTTDTKYSQKHTLILTTDRQVRYRLQQATNMLTLTTLYVLQVDINCPQSYYPSKSVRNK